MDILIRRRASEFWLLAMFPVYFGLNGLYKTTSALTGGFVVPVSFYVGIFISFFIVLRFIGHGIDIYRPISTVILFYVVGAVFFLIATAMYGTFTAAIPFMQFMSGVLGVIIAYWCFEVKKIDFGYATVWLSLMYLVLIALNVFEALRSTGLAYFLDRHTSIPQTLFGSILHPWVYYPYLVTAVFLFAVPYYRKKLNPIMFYALYGSVFVYILLYQVRGAILSFVLGFIAFFFVYVKNKKERIFLISAVAAAAILLLLTSAGIRDWISIQFGNSFFTTMGGRNGYYQKICAQIAASPLYLFTGSLFKAQSGVANKENLLITGGIDSYHNSYLELIDLGGIFLLLAFLFCVYSVLKLVYKAGKFDMRFKYWFCLILIEAASDFSINVPVRNTNPSILYWFLWIGCAIYAHRRLKPCALLIDTQQPVESNTV